MSFPPISECWSKVLGYWKLGLSTFLSMAGELSYPVVIENWKWPFSEASYYKLLFLGGAPSCEDSGDSAFMSFYAEKKWWFSWLFHLLRFWTENVLPSIVFSQRFHPALSPRAFQLGISTRDFSSRFPAPVLLWAAIANRLVFGTIRNCLNVSTFRWQNSTRRLKIARFNARVIQMYLKCRFWGAKPVLRTGQIHFVPPKTQSTVARACRATDWAFKSSRTL